MCIPLRIYMRNPMQIGASPAAKNSKNKEFHADEANSSFFVLHSSFIKLYLCLTNVRQEVVQVIVQHDV